MASALVVTAETVSSC